MGQINHALILAGGLGQRLWPLSRKQTQTKEAVDLHSKTMLELTVLRLSKWVSKERIWIISPNEIETYGCRLIQEPFRKNTAAAISWALSTIIGSDRDAFVGIFPVDHLISPFENLLEAFDIAKRKRRITALGIDMQKKKPSSQYGYLKAATPEGFSKLVKFVEKPLNPEYYVERGYLANSGIYLGPAKKILAEIRRFLPNHYFAAQNRDYTLFSKLRPVSIDKGVMEKTDHLFVYSLDVKWEDLGTLEAYLEHGGEKGNFIKHRAKGSLVHADNELVVVLGIEDVLVINKNGLTLVMKRGFEKKMDEVLFKIQKDYPGFI